MGPYEILTAVMIEVVQGLMAKLSQTKRDFEV